MPGIHWRHLPIGSHYGQWTVVGLGYTNKPKAKTRVPCVCECGTFRNIIRDELTAGKTTSCSCGKWKLPKAGDRFSAWVVLRIEPQTNGRKVRALCRCDCGEQRSVYVHSLREGTSRSCGCNWRNLLAESHLKHGDARGHTSTPEYSAWQAMLTRCLCPTASGYNNYGGRGIIVCERWQGEHGFEHFLADMGRRPSLWHSLDRYPNNNGNYEPGNCRWATVREQGRNRRTNRLLTFNGVSKCVVEWAECVGVQSDVLFRRLKNGWNVEDTLSFPVAKNGKERLALTMVRRHRSECQGVSQ